MGAGNCPWGEWVRVMVMKYITLVTVGKFLISACRIGNFNIRGASKVPLYGSATIGML